MTQSHRIKGETADQAFQEQCVLRESVASVGADIDLLNFRDLVHARGLE